LPIGLSARSCPISQWFWADSQQQLSGLSMGMMALALALAPILGVGSMNRRFSQTLPLAGPAPGGGSVYSPARKRRRAARQRLAAVPSLKCRVLLPSLATGSCEWAVGTTGSAGSLRHPPVMPRPGPVCSRRPGCLGNPGRPAKAQCLSEQLAYRLDAVSGLTVSCWIRPAGDWSTDCRGPLRRLRQSTRAIAGVVCGA